MSINNVPRGGAQPTPPPIGLNSPIFLARFPDFLDVGPRTAAQWSYRKILPPPRGWIMTHRYWLVRDIIEWARETGRGDLVRPTWDELLPSHIIDEATLAADEGYWEP